MKKKDLLIIILFVLIIVSFVFSYINYNEIKEIKKNEAIIKEALTSHLEKLYKTDAIFSKELDINLKEKLNE